MGRTGLVLAVILALTLAATSCTAEGDLKVVFLDAGEGDAIYVEAPTGERALIDAGNLITGVRVAGFLKERGGRLDALIITHPHPDHMGGVFHLFDTIATRARYDNGQAFAGPGMPSEDVYRWYGEIFRKGNYRALRAGDRLALGGATIDVLWPEAVAQIWNRNSLVMLLTYGKTRFLLMGDADDAVERALMEKGISLKAEVLKVGHHGAGNSSSAPFIDAVSPRYAVVSVNSGNVRGLPLPGAIERFRKRGVKLLFTFKEGDVAFKSDGKSVRLVTPAPARARPLTVR